MNVKIYVRALLCLYLSYLFSIPKVAAQELKVGDTIPPELWNLPLKVMNHPEGRETVTLSEYKDKPVILDFWATWCGSCIKKFPEIGILQERFGDKLHFIGATTDTPAQIESFTNKYRLRNVQRYVPPTLIMPGIFKELFRYKAIPHYVWIAEGRISAITSADDVSEKNINDFINGESFLYRLKEEQADFRASKPLFVNGNGGELKEDNFYRSFLTGRVEGLQKIMTVIKPDTSLKVKKLTCINCDLSDLFSLAYPEIIHYPKSRIFSDKDCLRLSTPFDSSYIEEIVYSYELNTPPTAVSKANDWVRQDLKRFLNVRGVFEDRLVDCVILTADKSIQNAYTKGGRPENNLHTTGEQSFLKNYPVKTLVAHLNKNRSGLFYIDETGCRENLDLVFHENIEDYQRMSETLLPQGLVFSRVKKVVRVFVIYC